MADTNKKPMDQMDLTPNWRGIAQFFAWIQEEQPKVWQGMLKEMGDGSVAEGIKEYSKILLAAAKDEEAEQKEQEDKEFDPVNDNPSLEFDEPMDGDHESALASAYGDCEY